MMKSLLCVLTLLPLVLGTHDLSFSAADRTIAFAVNVSTTGWVGLGISPNGGMVNSDVVIGWVSNGRTYFHVSFRIIK